MKMLSPPDSGLTALSKSPLFLDYAAAFTRGTGLPLCLHAPDLMQAILYRHGQNSPFGILMAFKNKSCIQSRTRGDALQQQLEKEAQFAPHTLKCFTGLCETAVPVRVGEKLIAFLHTGQVLLHRPSKSSFLKITRILLSWGAQPDLKKLEIAYFNTRVLSSAQYGALVRLLAAFATQLAAGANALSLHSNSPEPQALADAREFIEQNSHEDLRLSQVAEAVHMSASYFSERFKETTGINFVEYVARTRVEEARTLLQNPQRRISEVAFHVGFQSLSQFNRSFRAYCGQSPREFRETLTSAVSIAFSC